MRVSIDDTCVPVTCESSTAAAATAAAAAVAVPACGTRHPIIACFSQTSSTYLLCFHRPRLWMLLKTWRRMPSPRTSCSAMSAVTKARLVCAAWLDQTHALASSLQSITSPACPCCLTPAAFAVLHTCLAASMLTFPLPDSPGRLYVSCHLPGYLLPRRIAQIVSW